MNSEQLEADKVFLELKYGVKFPEWIYGYTMHQKLYQSIPREFLTDHGYCGTNGNLTLIVRGIWFDTPEFINRLIDELTKWTHENPN